MSSIDNILADPPKDLSGECNKRSIETKMPGVVAKRGPKSPMTDQHKAALAVGRSEGKAVRDYLDALRTNKPKRGRKRTAESISRRLDAIEAELEEADPVRELKLVQERIDLNAELAGFESVIDTSELEAAFISVAQSYSERNSISYGAWRQIGVEPAVLRKAGIHR